MSSSKQDLRKSLRDRIVQLEKNAELREDKLIKVIERIEPFFDAMSATKQQEVLEEITNGD